MMGLVEFTDIKAPDPIDGVPPWQDPLWGAAAEDWISGQCARAGLARTGPALGRGRVYSVVARVPVANGTVWFKASPPASSFEPALLVALAGWYPDRFAAPVAVDLDQAWSLTSDGGPTLRERAARPGDVDPWHVMLRAYAQLQLDLVCHAKDLLALGVADLRPDSVSPLASTTPTCTRTTSSPPPAPPSTGAMPRSRTPLPASSSPCAPAQNRPASRRDPRS